MRPGITRLPPRVCSIISSPTRSAAVTPSRRSAIRTDGRIIIRNSWGTAWGDKGFGYASETYINAGILQRELWRVALNHPVPGYARVLRWWHEDQASTSADFS